MKEKRLKIGYGVRPSKSARATGLKEFPRLILQGNWFENAGFKVGDVVSVRVGTGLLEVSNDGGPTND